MCVCEMIDIKDILLNESVLTIFSFVRPEWNAQTTPDELERMERESFLDWRRALAQ